MSCTTLIQCDWRKLIALKADILSDTMLVAAPGAATFLILHYTESNNTVHVVSLLWNIGTTTVRRVGLIAIFSSTIATTAVSLVHAVYIIMFGGLPEIFTAVIEVRREPLVFDGVRLTVLGIKIAVSLIVCNLSVLVPVALRLYRQGIRSKGSTTEEKSQGFRKSDTTGKRTQPTQLEATGNFDPRTEYTFGRVTIARPQESQSPLPPDGPSEIHGKEPLHSYNGRLYGCHDSKKTTFSTPFIYSSKEEEKAGRRGWDKGVKVARDVIANIPLDKDPYTHQGRTVVRLPQNATSRPTRADLEDYWGSGIKTIHKEDASRI